MKKNIKSNLFAILLISVLFLTLIYLKGSAEIFLSIFLIIYATILCIRIKKKKVISIRSKQVTILMFALAIINVSIYYILGLYFGFESSSIKLSKWSIIYFFIPTIIIIVTSEIIRYRFTMKEGILTKTLVVIAMILVEVVLYTQTYNIKILEDFLTVLGFIIFDAIASNLLYEYLTVRYGNKPIIVYRLITGLYMFILPIVPSVHIFLRTIIRMIVPYIIYLFIEFAFKKREKIKDNKTKRKNYVLIGLTITIIVLMSMLISCKFYIGIMVVGSESMTGTINKGDATIFVQHRNQEIKEGDILLFNKNNINIIHRVIGKVKVGDVNRYYTKGDANAVMDSEYTNDSEVFGIAKLRIPYIGYPTLWLREAFSKIR